jgi:hypothetical protein
MLYISRHTVAPAVFDHVDSMLQLLVLLLLYTVYYCCFLGCCKPSFDTTTSTTWTALDDSYQSQLPTRALWFIVLYILKPAMPLVKL